jgi:hypothetical protein
LESDDQRRYLVMMGYHNLCKQFAWQLLRYTNLDTDSTIAFAEDMVYENRTQEIKIMNGMLVRFGNKFRSFTKSLFS